VIAARVPPWNVFDVLTSKRRGAGRLGAIWIGLVEVRYVNIRWDVEVRLVGRLTFLRAVFHVAV
jgi:hypothetical protein